jgi:hypothetical protein
MTCAPRTSAKRRPLTAAQRAAVIELLRHAASLESYEEHAHGSFLRSAAIQLLVPAEIEELARRACCYVHGALDAVGLSKDKGAVL